MSLSIALPTVPAARRLLGGLLLAALAACGGGGGGSSTAGASNSAPIVQAPGSGTGDTAPSTGGSTPGTGAATNASPGTGKGGATPGTTPGAGTDASGGDAGSGSGSSSGSESTGGSGSGSSGTSAGGDAGTGGASGSGSAGGTGDGTGDSSGSGAAGQGDGGSGADGSGSGVAGGTGSGGTGGGGDGSGTGSGGTGATAAGIAMGAIDGFGSVIVNGVRFDNQSAAYDLEEITALAIGHVVRVDGSFTAASSSGRANAIHAAPELQGALSTVNRSDSTFVVLGQQVSISAATVFDGLTSVADLAPGDFVRVSGLPFQSGQLLASRISKLTARLANQYATGQLTSSDVAGKSFFVGALKVGYTAATAIDGGVGTTLRVGAYVRVNGSLGSGNVLAAARIRPWQVPAIDMSAVTWAGVVDGYSSSAAFTLAGLAVDASAAQITGGPASSIGNGVRVEIDGVMIGGVLKAGKLRIRHVPGTGGPASFTLSGTIGAFTSAASFRVQGQPIDASAANVVFVNGTAAKLGNGKKVSIVGSRLNAGVLIAETVTFD